MIKINFSSNYTKTAGWMFFEKFIRFIFIFLANIFVAKGLGPSEYGSINYILSFISIAGAIATLGSDKIVVKEIASGKFEGGRIVGSIFLARFGVGLLIYLSLSISLILSGGEPHLVLLLGLAIIFQSANVVENLLLAVGGYKYYSMISIMVCTITGIIKITISILQPTAEAIAIAIALDSALIFAGLAVINHKKKVCPFLKWTWSSKEFIIIMRQSLPLMFSGILYTVYTNFDLILLNSKLNSTEVGIYSSATKIAFMWYIIPGVILSSIMSYIVQNYKNKDIYLHRTLIVTRVLFWLGVFIALFLSIFAAPLVDLLLGSEYSRSTEMLRVLAICTPLVFVHSAWSTWMIVENRNKLAMASQFVIASANILLNIILIDWFGTVGAAYAYVASMATGLTYAALVNQRMRIILTYSIYLKKISTIPTLSYR